MAMDLPQIKYFLAVCQVRGFTRAAAFCGISQPSLSVAIQRLEEELGGTLFDRGPPLQLSPLGQAVKPHFRAILREIDKIHRIGSGLTDARVYSGNSGQLRFSLPSAFPPDGVAK
jgi:LysR family transcriptional regulator, hydrogen peroxide-inducible genes activator